MTPAPPSPPPRFTGLRLLVDNDQAWQAKRHLIGSAQRTLDLAYFILEVDGSTTRLLLDLVAAAQRGVQVRLLVDYFLTFQQAPVLRCLAEQPNIQVRRYNPPSATWVAALQAGGIDSDGFIKGLMATDGARMARALKGNTLLPPAVAQALAALQAQPGQSVVGFAQQVLAVVSPGGLGAAGDVGDADSAALPPAIPDAAAVRMAAVRQVATVITIVRGLKQFFHRCHHKLLLADGQRFIMGGRNLADAYHRTQPPPPIRAFQDTDILAHDGLPGGSGHCQTFEHLWTHPLTVDIQRADPLDSRPALPLADWQGLALPESANPPASQHVSQADSLSGVGIPLPDMDGTLVDNLPSDKGDPTITRAYTQRIRQFTASGQPGSIDIVNAYVLLLDDDRDSADLLALRNALLDAARAGITVNLHTNSLASTDLKPVNLAAYPKLVALIEGGVNVLELAADDASLHTKCAAIGDHCLVIGSYNFDPRSELYDTNNLLVLEDGHAAATRLLRASRVNGLPWAPLSPERALQLAALVRPGLSARLTEGLL